MIKEKKEKDILLISFISGLLFAVAEYIFSIFSHSQSVLMDAVYDASELIFIALILFLTPLFYKPVSEEHPYGFYQIESIFLLIKSFMMLAVTVSVSVGVIESALSGGNTVDEADISAFQLILGVASLVIFLIIKRMNKHLSSPTVNAELLGWRLDIAYSAGMAIAFFGASFLEKTPLYFIAPYFDQLMAVIVMSFTLPDSIRVLLRAVKDVFLFPPDEETVEKIRGICTPIMEESSFEPVFFDITRTGRHIWVEIYFEIEGNYLPVKVLRKTSKLLNETVAKSIPNCSCELIPSCDDD